MTRKQILEIRRRADSASPAPWSVDVEIVGRDVRVVGPTHRGAGASRASGGTSTDLPAIFDAAFVRSARDAVPALLDHVEQLELELATAREQLRQATVEARRLRQTLEAIASPEQISAGAHLEACRLADRALRPAR